MARLIVDVTVRFSTQVEVEVEDWTDDQEQLHSPEDQEAAWSAIKSGKKFALEEALESYGSDDFTVVEVLRESEVEIPKVQAPKHEDMWEDNGG